MPKPYTVKFGPWLPDLQDVGIEMPFQWTETELPVADCENVYWQDAAYRCLPAPASFGPTLGIPILSCFTWYDNTAGKEVVFAATASGFYQLIDNAWTQIPVQQNASSGTVGYAISLGMGAPAGVAVWLSPAGGQSDTGTVTPNNTFAPVEANNGNGNPTAYHWTFSGQSGPGTYSIASGQGDSVAVPQVTGVTAGDTCLVTLSCSITLSGGNSYSCSTPLSYTNNPQPSPTQRTYESGSGIETTPPGYNTLVIELNGVGGGGSSGGPTVVQSGITHHYGGGGGGGGAYCRSQYSISPVGGQTMSYAFGTPGSGGSSVSQYSPGTDGTSSTVSAGSLSITTMTANAGKGAPGDTGGAGGTAFGGNQVNNTGNTGKAGGEDAVGAGGAAIAGEYTSGAGAGGNSGLGASSAGASGSAGAVSFYYTYVP